MRQSGRIVIAQALLAAYGLAACAYAVQGAPVCARCHRTESEQFLKSPMGNSIGAPSALPAGKITHSLSDSTITIERRGGEMTHGLVERGLTAEYPVAWQIGSNRIGYTYMVRIGNYLFESPASWYRSHGWDTSPGYQHLAIVDFDRLVGSACLFCHTDSAKFDDSDGHRFSGTQLTPISCDRCHGPGTDHARHPTAKNIINPAKLPRAARDSICEQCHFEGEVRVLNPGKRWLDFHPGEAFEQTAVTYVAAQSGGAAHAVSQAEQLALSKCAPASGGRLWCATCHNPHKQAVDAAEVRNVCLRCHRSLSPEAHPAAATDCVSCHMPRLTTDDIPHSASTDHRIPRRPRPIGDQNATPDSLVAWREPPATVRDRDLAVAYMIVCVKYRSNLLRNSGTRRLNSLSLAPDDHDNTLLAYLAGNAVEQGNLERAVNLARRGVESAPDSGHAALMLAIALEKSGDRAGAEHEYVRASSLDPTLLEPWTELVKLYQTQARMPDVRATIDRYLTWNPQSILIRMQKARLFGEP
jgi:predicted CXXCH cytochrome family protein